MERLMASACIASAFLCATALRRKPVIVYVDKPVLQEIKPITREEYLEFRVLEGRISKLENQPAPRCTCVNTKGQLFEMVHDHIGEKYSHFDPK